MKIKDRVVELRRVKASELSPHPQNWRQHPENQQNALRAALADIGYADALRAELSQSGISVHVVCPGSVATNVSRNALTADGSARGRSDSVIEQGMAPEEAARRIIDGVEEGEREIIVARGGESSWGEQRRTPDALFDEVAQLVASGYMDRIEGED